MRDGLSFRRTRCLDEQIWARTTFVWCCLVLNVPRPVGRLHKHCYEAQVMQ